MIAIVIAILLFLGVAISTVVFFIGHYIAKLSGAATVRRIIIPLVILSLSSLAIISWYPITGDMDRMFRTLPVAIATAFLPLLSFVTSLILVRHRPNFVFYALAIFNFICACVISTASVFAFALIAGGGIRML